MLRQHGRRFLVITGRAPPQRREGGAKRLDPAIHLRRKGMEAEHPAITIEPIMRNRIMISVLPCLVAAT
jgi:hypothetical protein